MGNGQPYGQVPPFVFRRKENTFAKAEAIPAVACREAYDSLYTIEGGVMPTFQNDPNPVFRNTRNPATELHRAP